MSRRHTRRSRPAAPATAALAVALAAATLTSCAAPANTAAPVAGSCPPTIVSQLSWWTDPTHAAFLTPLVSDIATGELTVDDGELSITRQLRVEGVTDPITWEVRAGGPARGGSTVADLMYTDKAITLGQQATEEQIAATAASRPTLAVLAPLDRDPVGYAWDPEVFPELNTVADVGETDIPVLAYDSPSLQYLTGSGKLKEEQVDTSYDGSPSRFLAARGRLVVAGFSTGLPYTYSHLGPQSRTLKFAYLDGVGYPSYRNLVTVRTADRPSLDWCLRRIVPMMQQAQAEFMADPEPTLRLVERVNLAWRNPEPWSIDKGLAAWEVMRRDELVSAGSGAGGFGAADLRPTSGIGGGRIRRMLDVLVPAFRKKHIDVPDGLTPAQLATNDYLDPRITLPPAPTR